VTASSPRRVRWSLRPRASARGGGPGRHAAAGCGSVAPSYFLPVCRVRSPSTGGRCRSRTSWRWRATGRRWRSPLARWARSGGAGDLGRRAHLALALVGEDEGGEQGGGDAGAALRAAGLEPIELEAKEGLAFVNGTQAQAGLAALLVHDAWVLWRTAHAAAAMSLEAVRGTPEPFDARIHAARPHPFPE